MTVVRDRLSDILREVVGVEPPPADVDLVNSGLIDSLTLITLLAELEEAFVIEIPLEDLDLKEIQTLDRLADLVERQRHATAEESIAPVDEHLLLLRAGGDGPPVFLFPNLTGIALALRPLAHALRGAGSVHALTPVAHEDRQPPLRVEDLADVYARAIRSLPEGADCVLGGVSFGGLVAFETARRLRASGTSVAHVVLMDARPASQSLTRVEYLLFRLTQPLRALLYVAPHPRERLPELAEKAAPLLPARVRARLGLDRRASEPSEWQRIADAAAQVYRPGAYGGDVTLLVTAKAPLTTFRPQTVWHRRVHGALTIRPIPGGHLDFLQGGRLAGIAAHISRVLEALRS